MRQVEIEKRYLLSSLETGALSALVGNSRPDHTIVYCNYGIDQVKPQEGVILRAANSPLRLRLYAANERDVSDVLSAKAGQRLAMLWALRDGRKAEFTLKVPAPTGRGELERVPDIARYLNMKGVRSVADFRHALADAGMGICSAVLTRRKQWDMGKLTDHAQLIVTSDASRCHHQMSNCVPAREIVEIEACVQVPDRTSKARLKRITSEAEAALHRWIRAKLGRLPKSVIGTGTACVLVHTPHLGRKLVEKKAVKPSLVDAMYTSGELTDQQKALLF